MPTDTTSAEAARELTPVQRACAWLIAYDRDEIHLDVKSVTDLIREAEERGAKREREACLADIEGERLTGETGDEGDEAYNMALEHAAMVIRARPLIALRAAADDVGGEG